MSPLVPSPLDLVSALAPIDARAFELARDVLADPSRRPSVALEARDLLRRASAIATEIDVAGPAGNQAAAERLSETMLDLKFALQDSRFRSLRLSRIERRAELRVPDLVAAIGALAERADSLTRSARAAQPLPELMSTFRAEARELLSALGTVADDLKATRRSAYDEHEEGITRAFEQLRALGSG